MYYHYALSVESFNCFSMLAVDFGKLSSFRHGVLVIPALCPFRITPLAACQYCSSDAKAI